MLKKYLWLFWVKYVTKNNKKKHCYIIKLYGKKWGEYTKKVNSLAHQFKQDESKLSTYY